MNNDQKEINRGYIQFVKALNVARIKKVSLGKVTGRLWHFCQGGVRILMVPILFTYCLMLTLVLRIRLLFNRGVPSWLHDEATAFLSQFAEQYPLHLYPLLAKSLEMAFIQRQLGIMEENKGALVELAVGEGTFSARIFSNGDWRITAFDINPYSLVHTKNYSHISRRIVADCLNPPLARPGASFILCNNLLHHVTEKEQALRNWSEMAPLAMFNENTSYWASSWFWPSFLVALGFRRWAAEKAAWIERKSMQYLRSKAELEVMVEKYYAVTASASFFSARTFFLAAVPSLLLGCYGPPTPKLSKMIFNRFLPTFSRLVSIQTAKALISYDRIAPRGKDTFIFWLGRSVALSKVKKPSIVSLTCPDCRVPLKGSSCPNCGKKYEEINGMVFLLSKDLSQEITMEELSGNILEKEHL